MIDREKVIGELEVIKYFFRQCRENFSLGSDVENSLFDLQEAADGAITLLKEQEAVEPSFKQDEKGIFIWCCGSCGAYMYHIYDGIDKAKEYAKYCRQCGKKVKWE